MTYTTVVGQVRGGTEPTHSTAGALPPHPRPRLEDALGESGVGEWASHRVVTQGRSTEPPGLQPLPDAGRLPRRAANFIEPDPRGGVVVLPNRRDGQACRRDEMPPDRAAEVCRWVATAEPILSATARPHTRSGSYMTANTAGVGRLPIACRRHQPSRNPRAVLAAALEVAT
jgi:hypothetical protein